LYRHLERRLAQRVGEFIRLTYGLELAKLVIEQPPKVEFGDYALPLAFELARKLRKAPRKIAEEIVSGVGPIEGFEKLELAGTGYINARVKRAELASALAADEKPRHEIPSGKVLVEHSSINPNKAAHIGHLRNAILGDTFQRLLRPDSYKSGFGVGVQNYIDNTGVQVADVVVGLMHLERKDLAATKQLLSDLAANGDRIDFYCWDLYARVSQWYTADDSALAERKALRLATLHAIEEGGNEIAQVADLIATAVLRRHLETMQRLSIEYDFLPRESEILHLHFWDAARQLMIDKGVLYIETEGKNKGCWVMRRAPINGATESTEPIDEKGIEDAGPDEDAKVIVRSNGTVTYVGKDIAYHLWKFGLLPGKDFGYKKFYEYPSHTCWISAERGDTPHPSFGHADAIYNVIDSRQNDPQTQVIQALRGMGFTEAADRYTHFSYEMVALTPRCAIELGYPISEEDQKRAYIEVSGRKGFGVKADDLLDRLIAAARAEVDTRHPDLSDDERATIAKQIGVGALRYFMLRYTRNTVIAFDFKDALSFEGETGPYVQYAIVRAANIFRKANTTEAESLIALEAIPTDALAAILNTDEGSSLWETWLLVSKLTLLIDQCINTAEPAYLAKYAFQLAQQFNNFYHRHHILHETNPTRKAFYFATAAVAQREMIRALGYLGIEAPERM
jgi:arginyl-tRNA synthetase